MRPALLLVLPALIPAGPALALTPEALVATWRTQAAEWGTPFEVEVEEQEDGSLLVRNVAPPPPDAADFMPVGSPLREAVLVPMADGTVEIRGGMGERFDLPLDPAGLALRIEQTNARMLARDGADEPGIDYAYSADVVRIVLLPPPDRAHEASETEFALELSDVAAQVPARAAPEGNMAFDLEVSAAGLAYVMSSSDPVMGRTGGWARVESPTLGVSATVPASAMAFFGGLSGREPNPAELGQVLGAAFADGMEMRFDLASGGSTSASSAEGGVLSYSLELSGGPGRTTYAVDRAGLLLSGSGEGMSVTASAADLPFDPLEVRFGPMELEFRLPLFAAAPEPFRLRAALEDVTVGDAAWDALDPGRVLPREPMRFVYDLGGRMALNLDGLMEAQATGRPVPPPQVESLELRELELSALGALASGSGAVTFNASMLPTGSGVLTLTGIDRLLDAAVTLGLATPRDLVPLRFGLASYFDAGEGEDVITSRIDIAGRAVTMNGVPLPVE